MKSLKRENIKEYKHELQTELLALYLASKRKDIPWYARLWLAVVIAYALSPVDLIPDFIPILGYIDDLILLPLGFALAIRLIPEEVMKECRREAASRLREKMPRNWTAGILIIGIWILLIFVIVKNIFALPLNGLLSKDEAIKYSLLFAGSFIAAAISGAAGFGGALLLLPLLTKTIGTALAVPVLTLAQLIGNLSRVFMGFNEIKWKPVLLFIAGALPAAWLGAWSFAVVDKHLITRIIGVSIIIFVILKYFNLLRFRPGNITLLAGGMLVGGLSGLVGSAGPLGAAIFLALNLPPVAYVASEAVTATVMHIVKTIAYQRYLDIGWQALGIGLFMGIAMVGGTWAGKKIIEKMPQETFVKFVGILLCLVGLQMAIWG
ncbi:Uncharacterized membrane protein YkvA, DUF1232 family [Thermosyntropha lipolytica DSM 11003]|uniref:Probable membrane transporter protein n=1 Tax=Thermosyntropha lipolytica DSM 11003 TaxID=1123382 RepID=A0A1M5L945_9FIRM|nr:TSUP family transporter [Thermosyntropha lipolytica]SHG61622.1 Uncharacterized membrane protein YkvA, DUF1232 family [Thermosyntropha lipolytica DSM 11003]